MTTSASRLIRTSDEQTNAVELIEEMLAENFKNNAHPKSATKSTFLSKLYSFLLEKIQAAGNNRENTDKLLKDALSEVKNLKELKITLALYPDDKVLEGLENWLNNNGMENFIFDINVDQKILGGAIIVGDKGEYRDFSLSKRLDTYLASPILNS